MLHYSVHNKGRLTKHFYFMIRRGTIEKNSKKSEKNYTQGILIVI